MNERAIQLLEEALNLLRESVPTRDTSPTTVVENPVSKLVWGSKVSEVFKDRVKWIAADLGFNPNWLMAAMAFESGETFSASVKNAAGSGATGLIQFMPSTAKGLNTTVKDLAALSPEDQLKFVYKYFLPYKGRIKSLDDLYMAILWPSAIGKPPEYKLFIRGGVTYRQNAGLDRDKNGYVSKAEAAAAVRAKYERGKDYLG